MASQGARGSEPRSKAKRLGPKEIKYLVLEGGGGKGFAFLGAIQVLEKLEVVQNIQGFGGASAGAITALLLSMGMGSRAIADFLNTTDFGAFFDPPVPRRRPPFLSGLPPVENSKQEKKFIEDRSLTNFIPLFFQEPFASNAGADIEQLTAIGSLLFSNITPQLGKSIGLTLNILGVSLKQSKEKSLIDARPFIDALLSGGRHYFAYLPRDMGLFSGERARNVFRALIYERAHRGKKYRVLRAYNDLITFKQHFEIFGKELVMTGTNLRTGSTVIFSKDETPEYPVADAVRISMGLPYLYKPYVIDEAVRGWPPCGVYVDGGVWNNLPYREFES